MLKFFLCSQLFVLLILHAAAQGLETRIKNVESGLTWMKIDGGERLMQQFMTSVALEYAWPVMKSYPSPDLPGALQSVLPGKYENAAQDYFKLSFAAKEEEITLNYVESIGKAVVLTKVK